MAGELERRVEVAEVVDRLSDGDLDGRERGRLLAHLTRLIAGGVRAAGARAAMSGRYLTDLVTQVAPSVVVRDLATLRADHGGLSGDELADALVRQAARATAGVGAAGGALAAVQHAAPPSLVVAPVQLAAETVAVVVTELKLVAELHVAYGRAPVAAGAGARGGLPARLGDPDARRPDGHRPRPRDRPRRRRPPAAAPPGGPPPGPQRHHDGAVPRRRARRRRAQPAGDAGSGRAAAEGPAPALTERPGRRCTSSAAAPKTSTSNTSVRSIAHW